MALAPGLTPAFATVLFRIPMFSFAEPDAPIEERVPRAAAAAAPGRVVDHVARHGRVHDLPRAAASVQADLPAREPRLRDYLGTAHDRRTPTPSPRVFDRYRGGRRSARPRRARSARGESNARNARSPGRVCVAAATVFAREHRLVRPGRVHDRELHLAELIPRIETPRAEPGTWKISAAAVPVRPIFGWKPLPARG